MKLLSLEIVPELISGWGTDVLRFGDHITQLYGPNGCGKTPIIQTIAFCLGYPSEFRNDIYDRCSHAVLRVEVKGKVIEIVRIYSRDFDVQVKYDTGVTERFYNEREFSECFFGIWEFDYPKLSAVNNKVAEPYISTILPIFYVDQDEGYSKLYAPPSNFLKNQLSEMVRVVFGFNPKNPFDKKKERYDAKAKLDNLDRLVKSYSDRVRSFEKDMLENDQSSHEIQSQINELESHLESLAYRAPSKDESMLALDRLVASNLRRIHEFQEELIEVRKRRSSIKKIVKDIESEIGSLNLNEEAKRVFLSFNEVCNKADCGLFFASSEAYAKNLLYLKDQIKDLVKNDEFDMQLEDRLCLEIKSLEKYVEDVEKEREALFKKSDASAIIALVSEVKNEIFRLQSKLSDLETLERLKSEYTSVLIRRDNQLQLYSDLSSTKSDSAQFAGFRRDLREAFVGWLDVIHTLNVNRDISFKDDFVPILGDEKVSQLKGSTRVRAILSYHAALFELSSYKSNGIRLLILDTPKQHEINNAHLESFFGSLKDLCAKNNVQVVFSTTEYKYNGDGFDRVWVPKYPGKEQNMFLKEVNS